MCEFMDGESKTACSCKFISDINSE